MSILLTSLLGLSRRAPGSLESSTPAPAKWTTGWRAAAAGRQAAAGRRGLLGAGYASASRCGILCSLSKPLAQHSCLDSQYRHPVLTRQACCLRCSDNRQRQHCELHAAARRREVCWVSEADGGGLRTDCAGGCRGSQASGWHGGSKLS